MLWQFGSGAYYTTSIYAYTPDACLTAVSHFSHAPGDSRVQMHKAVSHFPMGRSRGRYCPRGRHGPVPPAVASLRSHRRWRHRHPFSQHPLPLSLMRRGQMPSDCSRCSAIRLHSLL